MAKIKKIIEEGSIQYPATITDAVKNPNNGKTVTQELSELGSKISQLEIDNTFSFYPYKINSETGKEEVSAVRVSTGFIDSNLIESIDVTNNNHTVYCKFYDKQKNFLRELNISSDNCLPSNKIHIGDYLIRLTVKNNDDSQFNLSDAVDSIKINGFNSFLELKQKISGSIRFEQGKISSEGEGAATNRVRSINYINAAFYIILKEGYKIYRIAKYNKDFTYDSYIDVNSKSYLNLDTNYLYRVVIVKDDESSILPTEQFIKEYKSGADLLNQYIAGFSSIDLTDYFASGYYQVNEIGAQLGALIKSNTRKHYAVKEFKIGDVYKIYGTGGSTGLLWAKIKDNIIIESGNSLSEVTILCDGYFDTIIFNVLASEDYYLRANINKPIDLLTDTFKDIKQKTEEINEKVLAVGSSEHSLEVGTIASTGEINSTTRLRSKGYINTGFYVSVKEGLQIYRIAKYNKDMEYIGYTDVHKSSISYPNLEGELCRIVIASSNLTDVISDRTEDAINEFFSGSLYYDRFYLKEISREKFKNANIVVVGDSSVAASNWAQRMCEELNCSSYLVSAQGGQTIRTQIRTDGTLGNCLRNNIENIVIPHINNEWGGKVDILMLQIGGNDASSVTGTLEDSFADMNYVNYKEDITTYGGFRYCLELLRREYPNALITVGTVFQRLGNDIDGNATKVSNMLREVCMNLAIQIIEGNRYLGFSKFLEPSSPYYNDGNPGIKDDRTNLSRENPAYNYIDSLNNIVDYETATIDGVLNDGYSKRYGLYTYDGKHQNLKGEEKVLKYMKAELNRLFMLYPYK